MQCSYNCLIQGQFYYCDWDPVNSGKIFKLQNTCNGCGVLAAFHLGGENVPVAGTISPRDVEGLVEEGSYTYVDEIITKRAIK